MENSCRDRADSRRVRGDRHPLRCSHELDLHDGGTASTNLPLFAVAVLLILARKVAGYMGWIATFFPVLGGPGVRIRSFLPPGDVALPERGQIQHIETERGHSSSGYRSGPAPMAAVPMGTVHVLVKKRVP